MIRKSAGKFPFCEKKTSPIVIESNFFRRDKCKCTACLKIIYKCRNILCRDYAKGGGFYDDELCPSCGAGLLSSVKKLPAAVTAITESASNNSKNNKK